MLSCWKNKSFFLSVKTLVVGSLLYTRLQTVKYQDLAFFEKNPSFFLKIPLSLFFPKIPQKGTNPSTWQH